MGADKVLENVMGLVANRAVRTYGLGYFKTIEEAYLSAVGDMDDVCHTHVAENIEAGNFQQDMAKMTLIAELGWESTF